jgi:hypothetical protein
VTPLDAILSRVLTGDDVVREYAVTNRYANFEQELPAWRLSDE